MQPTIHLAEDTTKAKLKYILPKTKPLCKYATEVYIKYVAYLQHCNSICSRQDFKMKGKNVFFHPLIIKPAIMRMILILLYQQTDKLQDLLVKSTTAARSLPFTL